MERIKPKDIALLQELLSLDKPYFSPADLEKVLGQKRPALYVTLNRLARYGVLVRLAQGVYQIPLRGADLPRIANQLIYPSYLSFESALSRYGILSQSPYVLTFATSQRSRRLALGEQSVEFRQLKGELFFGYSLQSGLYVAEPEKALLDQFYMVGRGLSSLTTDELDLSSINVEQIRAYAVRFPSTVQEVVKRMFPESAIPARRPR